MGKSPHWPSHTTMWLSACIFLHYQIISSFTVGWGGHIVVTTTAWHIADSYHCSVCISVCVQMLVSFERNESKRVCHLLLIPKIPSMPRLCQVKARSPGTHLGLLHRWQECKYWRHHVLPSTMHQQEASWGAEEPRCDWHSHKGHKHPRQFNPLCHNAHSHVGISDEWVNDQNYTAFFAMFSHRFTWIRSHEVEEGFWKQVGRVQCISLPGWKVLNIDMVKIHVGLGSFRTPFSGWCHFSFPWVVQPKIRRKHSYAKSCFCVKRCRLGDFNNRHACFLVLEAKGPILRC